MLNRRRLLLTLLLSPLLSSCGFRLRGFIQLDEQLQPLRLQTDASARPLTAELSRQLSLSGVEVTDQPAEARVTLHLQNLQRDEVQVVFGASEEYAITLRVQASVEDAQGQWLLMDEDFAATRQYVDEDSSLVRNQIRAELEQQLRQDLIRQLILRIQTLSPQQPQIP